MNVPDLIETMHRDREGSIALLSLHLDRLSQSAELLGHRCDIDAIANAVRRLTDTPFDARVRIQLSADGQYQLTCVPFEIDRSGQFWTIRIAETRLQSDDPLLRHKTARREFYDKARAEFPAEKADEVLLLNERGELCEGTITTLFVKRASSEVLMTPKLSCGLLRGVLRQHLLDTNLAAEAVLRPADLEDADEFFVGNALRGLIPAQLG